MVVTDSDSDATVRPGRATGDSPEPRTGYLIRRLQHVVKEEMDSRLGVTGLTARQYTAISILRWRNGLSNAQLARRCLVSPQAMSEVVSDLEDRQLVRRVPHPARGRVLQTVLTPEGEDVLARADAAVAELENVMLAELAPAERQQLKKWLASCLRMLGAGIGYH